MEKLKETGSVDNFEIETVTKTGETINIILSWSLVGDIVSGMIIDITEHKQVEKRMLHSEKLKAMGVMAAGIAHDFNNMLAIIAGNAQLLHGSHGDDKELTDRLSTICKAANDGAEIVRRMRKFMVVKTDVSEFISVNIKDVIEQSVDFTMPRWKNMARAGGIKYDIDMKGVKEVPAIPGNPSELREVLINIINNALHVMPEGGTVLFCTWSNDNNVYVSISDSGTGMSEEVKEKIFDPFFTTKRAEGSGLGMSVSYGIVKSHGGNIEVESEDGKGCTFTLKFPIDRETRQSMVLPESTHKIKLEKLRILVIDDEEEICSILERFFSRNGHKVKSFMNCAEAIKILKSEEFDLVLCDLVMPDLTGHDVIEVMDKLERRPKIGLITGWDEKIETKDTEELKVDFIIKKPFEFSTLTRFVNDILDARLKDL
jgi:signal transduction histidine kinase/CheY-like chemotaxis protein